MEKTAELAEHRAGIRKHGFIIDGIDDSGCGHELVIIHTNTDCLVRI